MSRTNSMKPSDFAIPKVTTKQFEKMMEEQVIYMNATDRWDKSAPIMGHGSPGIGKSAMAENVVQKIEEITKRKTHLHIIDADQLEIGEFGYNFAVNPGDITFKHIAAMWMDFKNWAKSFLPSVLTGKAAQEEYVSVMDEVSKEEASKLPVAQWFRNGKYPAPDSEDCHVILIEELKSALPSQMTMLHGLILSRRAGQTPLPKRVYFIIVGNLVSDKGYVMDPTSPVANRCQHVEITVDMEHWVGVAVRNDINPLITAFTRKTSGQYLAPASMEPYGGGNYAFGSGRSWFATHETLSILDMKRKGTLSSEHVYEGSKEEQTAAYLNELHVRVQAHVGAIAAVQFRAFVESVDDVPDVSVILGVDSIDELDQYIPKSTSSMDGDQRMKQMGIVYYLLDSISQALVKNEPKVADKDNESAKKEFAIWRNGLNFFKKVADPDVGNWGDSIGILGITNLKSYGVKNLGVVAVAGGNSIMSWAGSKSQGALAEGKLLKNELLASRQ